MIEKGFNPCCGYITDASDSLPNFKTETPSMGDIAVCLNCGAILVYKDGLRNITQLARPEDLKALDLAQCRYIARAQRYIRARGIFKRRDS